MNLLLTTRIALRALGKNRMRAALTVLGVVIGIAAVTTMVSVGQSARALIMGEFESLGTNIIVITPARHRRGGVRQGERPTLTAQDADAVAQCPSVAFASPLVGAGGQAVYGNENWSPKEIFGVGTDYLSVRNWQVRQGGFFTERDIASAS